MSDETCAFTLCTKYKQLIIKPDLAIYTLLALHLVYRYENVLLEHENIVFDSYKCDVNPVL
jgi:hypothetical protein